MLEPIAGGISFLVLVVPGPRRCLQRSLALGVLGVLSVACLGQRRSVGARAALAAASGAPAKPSSSAAPLPRQKRTQQRETSIRVRVNGLEPGQPSQAGWRSGGEGLGGGVRRGVFVAADGASPLGGGEWSAPLRLSDLLAADDRKHTVMTLSAGPAQNTAAGTLELSIELEQLDPSGVVRSLRETLASGGAWTLVFPNASGEHLRGELSTAEELAKARFDLLREHSGRPAKALPSKLAVVSDLGGFGLASGYGVRVSEPATMSLELQALRLLGVNGLRAAPEFLLRDGLPGQPRLRARILGPIGYPTPDKRRDEVSAGCPFAADREARAEALASAAIDKAQRENADQVWILTQDEIGAVTDLALRGKGHLAACDRCRQGFVDWLKQRKLSPRDLGVDRWLDVRPTDIWSPGDRPWLQTSGSRRRAYLTREFLNVASAQLFTPLRDRIQRYNDAPKPAGASPANLFSYALRGSNFLTNGSSLDVFEFYRHADNAMVWETSNKDARSWAWDSYLTDVQRVLSERLQVAAGIYIKPHRGAPVQRMLSAVSRGVSLIYWYTYGPDYWKGDAFSSAPSALLATQRAAQLLGAAEDKLVGATPFARPRIAILKPETTLAWANIGDQSWFPVATLENAKWVYTALQHAHLPVDPLDERFVAELNLEQYAAIYVNGSHVQRRVASALQRYVRAGGVLVGNAGSALLDETNEPLDTLYGVFGVRDRKLPELDCPIESFRSARLQSLAACSKLATAEAAFATEPQPLFIGKEELAPLPESEVLARFSDGGAAMLRHSYGKGAAYLLGTFAGLEYAAPALRPGFDMRRDFEPNRRRYLAEPVTALVSPPVECSEALVEPVLLRPADARGLVLTLANWSYVATDSEAGTTGEPGHVALQPARDVRLLLRGVGRVTRVRSMALERDLSFQTEAANLHVTVPELGEGDVLLID